MLSEIPGERTTRTVFRLARASASDSQFLDELGLDAQARDELLGLLSERLSLRTSEELLDGPFRSRARLRHSTRFSDGSFPVFYSALEPETAKAEVAHWFRRDYVGTPRRIRKAYYQRFRCVFEGLEKDLRPKADDWPDLVHPTDYSFCNQLGMEAREEGVDGLIVPSARHAGDNLPIFIRRAVSQPKLEDLVTMTYDPNTDEVSIECTTLEWSGTLAQQG